MHKYYTSCDWCESPLQSGRLFSLHHLSGVVPKSTQMNCNSRVNALGWIAVKACEQTFDYKPFFCQSNFLGWFFFSLVGCSALVQGNPHWPVALKKLKKKKKAKLPRASVEFGLNIGWLCIHFFKMPFTFYFWLLGRSVFAPSASSLFYVGHIIQPQAPSPLLFCLVQYCN